MPSLNGRKIPIHSLRLRPNRLCAGFEEIGKGPQAHLSGTVHKHLLRSKKGLFAAAHQAAPFRSSIAKVGQDHVTIARFRSFRLWEGSRRGVRWSVEDARRFRWRFRAWRQFLCSAGQRQLHDRRSHHGGDFVVCESNQVA